MDDLSHLQHYVVVHMYDACNYVLRTSTEEKGGVHMAQNIASKEVTQEAAMIPRGILEMQDKTCLGTGTPPGLCIEFTPSYRVF